MIRHRVIESPLPLGSPRAPARRRRAPSPAWRSTRPRPPRLPGPDRPGGMASPDMQYSVDYPDMWRRTASYVDRILKGTKPGDLPIEQPAKFRLVINLRAAKALSLTIPPSLLLRADEIIQ